MDQLAAITLDLTAIAVLAFAVYYPRHRRRDLAVAFVGVNVGVLAVSMVLADATVGAGLGLGLFGVLSIIRLRSREIEQSEMSYYFAALAIGLISGLAANISLLSVGLVALVVAVIAIVDSPSLLRRSREQQLVLDRAYPDEAEARAAVETLLGTTVHRLSVRSLDLVSDTTVVDVRYNAPRPGSAPTRRDATLDTLHTLETTR
ncbi:MAG: DUF4956 domain-containing protein [Microbacterium sp. SCN 70-200]|uniref:DUF4956 domain-containing protein n=1 Tax=unclassified Microbacterium TaxID=2609290 RepID=UPI000868B9A7|nr:MULTISPECIES: DUF4956 domain-containing protein [unclassified Microbacterium]MBN9215543.1 DUF4956 domain-containing protein [Microbacterium sp.]ODT41171.1 MAG: DUF4956 domain-containing protein [Microbacterium sp. SCN 70-200]OJV79433.1 MAG: DUF4956 domain-containing protein [Microbacterium sp. 70-16]